MRKMIVTMLMAATVLPATMAAPASAQTARDVREARGDLREEQRELNRAYRHGDRRDVREEKRDVREARRDYDRELRQYRRSHRSVYARGKWNAPFRYQRWDRGVHLRPTYYAPRYHIADPWRYRLPPARPGLGWVRHYDDVLLVNMRTGLVVQVYRGFFW